MLGLILKGNFAPNKSVQVEITEPTLLVQPNPLMANIIIPNNNDQQIGSV
jgi:hypothetical protein